MESTLRLYIAASGLCESLASKVVSEISAVGPGTLFHIPRFTFPNPKTRSPCAFAFLLVNYYSVKQGDGNRIVV